LALWTIISGTLPWMIWAALSSATARRAKPGTSPDDIAAAAPASAPN
jgi:hypothetical protein